jgi:phage-related protein
LNFFEEVSLKFKNLETIDNKPLKTFFDDAAKNGVEFLKLLGNIAGGFLTLADNPELGVFFKQLNEVTDIFQRIGENLTGSLPAFGEFLIQFSLIIEKFTEAGSITIFFNVLSKVLEILNKFFASPVGQTLIKLGSFILPIAAAFGAIQIAAGFFFKVVIGNISRVVGSFTGLGRKISALKAGDPFIGVRKGSALTRTELQRQMIVDAQKKQAMNGIYISGQQAAAGIRAAGVASKTATPLIAAGGGAASKASIGLKSFGRAFALIGGPIGIILLLLPMIIENWDKIVAFFKELPAKIGEIFSKVWDKVTEALPKIIDKIKEWVGNVIGWLKENWPLILAVLTGPFGLLVLAVVKNWDKIIEFIQGIGAKLAEVGAKIWDWIVDSFKKVVDLYIGAWEAIFDFIKGLGGKLLEIGAKIWDWVVDTFKKAVELYIGAWEAVFTFIKGLGSKLLEIGKNIWDWIVDFLKQRIENLKTNFGLMIDFVKGLPAKALEAGKAIWGWVSERLTGVIDRAKGLFNGLIDWIKGLPGRVASAASGLFNGIRDAFRNALNWIIGKWNGLSFTLPSITAFGKTIGGGTFRVPPIPPFAKGGIVQPSATGTLGLIAEAGRPERIEPLDPDGLSKRDKAMIEMLAGPGKGVTVNVYPSAGMDERELAAIVSRQISYSLRRGAA